MTLSIAELTAWAIAIYFCGAACGVALEAWFDLRRIRHLRADYEQLERDCMAKIMELAELSAARAERERRGVAPGMRGQQDGLE